MLLGESIKKTISIADGYKLGRLIFEDDRYLIEVESKEEITHSKDIKYIEIDNLNVEIMIDEHNWQELGLEEYEKQTEYGNMLLAGLDCRYKENEAEAVAEEEEIGFGLTADERLRIIEKEKSKKYMKNSNGNFINENKYKARKGESMTAKEVYNYITDIRQQLDEYTAVYVEILGKGEDGELAGIEYDLNTIELIDDLLYLNGAIEIQDYEIAKIEHVNIKALKPIRLKGVRFILTESN